MFNTTCFQYVYYPFIITLYTILSHPLHPLQEFKNNTQNKRQIFLLLIYCHATTCFYKNHHQQVVIFQAEYHKRMLFKWYFTYLSRYRYCNFVSL